MGEIQFSNLAINTINGKTKNIYDDIFTLPKERKGFAFNQQIMVTPIYFYRVIGVEDESSYEKQLLELHNKLSQLENLYSKFDKGLDKLIPNGLIQEINKSWMQVEKISSPTGRMIVENTINSNRFPSINKVKGTLIKDKLSILVDIFMADQKNLNIVKNFYIKQLYWIEKYSLSLLSAYQYGDVNPKILFYGEIQKDEIYFLIFLSLIGFDILYLNSEDGSKFNDINNIDVYSNLIEFPNKISLRPFPYAPRMRRKETVAYSASKEIDQVLHTEDSGVYRPWQFENYSLISNPLKTTYEELFILWKEEARFREGFRAEAGDIYIPNIFAKVSGTPLEMDEYWKNIDSLLKEKESTILIEKIPFIKPRGYAPSNGLFNVDGSFKQEKIRQLREYRFAYLRTSVQDLILDKVNELALSEDLFKFPVTADFKLKILYTILGLEKPYLDLLQKFDYPLQIPKLVIFDSDETTFSQEDLIVIAFLHLVGFDIIILTPTGYNNIENGIHSYYYDIHKLEDLKFNLKLQRQQEEKTSVLKRGFLWFFQ